MRSECEGPRKDPYKGTHGFFRATVYLGTEKLYSVCIYIYIYRYRVVRLKMKGSASSIGGVPA